MRRVATWKTPSLIPVLNSPTNSSHARDLTRCLNRRRQGSRHTPRRADARRHRRLGRPWSWQVQNRLGPFLWLFGLWSALWALWAQVFPWNEEAYTPLTVLTVPLDPEYGPWFIYALAIYYLAVKLMHPRPLWLQFGIGAVVSLPVAFGLVTIDNFAWERTLTHFIIFQFGVYGHRTIAAIADCASVAMLVLVGGAFVVSFGILIALGGAITSPAWLPLTAWGMSTGIIASALIARYLPWLRLDWFGRHTLPIYLLHRPASASCSRSGRWTIPPRCSPSGCRPWCRSPFCPMSLQSRFPPADRTELPTRACVSRLLRDCRMGQCHMDPRAPGHPRRPT